MIEIFFSILFLFIAAFFIYKKYQEGKEEESLEVTEETQVTDQEEQQEEKSSSAKIIATIVIIVFAILVFAILNAWGAANNEAKVITRTDGSGDCEDEWYRTGVKISEVKSNSSVSFTSRQKIGRGKTNTLSFSHKGNGSVSLLVLPLENTPENQVNPRKFESVQLTDEWTLYEKSFCCPGECQIVVTINVPEGCNGEIKDFKIE